MSWLSFVRHYGPISRNDNMYDEQIQRSAKRQKIAPIEFEYPVAGCDGLNVLIEEQRILSRLFSTGTAGDGKTHLLGRYGKPLKETTRSGPRTDPDLSLDFPYPRDRKSWPHSNDSELYRSVKIHFIRDLSGWAPQGGASWQPEKEQLRQAFCMSRSIPMQMRFFSSQVTMGRSSNRGGSLHKPRCETRAELVRGSLGERAPGAGWRAAQVFQSQLLKIRQNCSIARL